jgi:hypothetical protein
MRIYFQELRGTLWLGAGQTREGLRCAQMYAKRIAGGVENTLGVWLTD